MAARPPKSLQSQLASLEAAVRGGDGYSALQRYKALFSRSKASADDAILILSSGSLCLSAEGQLQGAVDLAKELVKFVQENVASSTNELVQSLVSVCAALPCDHRLACLSSALKWNKSLQSSPAGHPSLHLAVAQTLEQQRQFITSFAHFARASDTEGLTRAAQAAFSDCASVERDVIVGLAVMSALCAEDLGMANATFAHLSAATALKTALINFLHLTLLTVEKNAAPLYRVLLEKYGPSLARHSQLKEQSGLIGQIYFSMPARRSFGGLFGA